MTSAPRFNSAICSEMPVPPYTVTTRKFKGFANLLHSLPICKHNSRVGDIIMATKRGIKPLEEEQNHSMFQRIISPIGPSVSSKAGWSRMCRNMGNKNANVLPLPVLAIPMMSRPILQDKHRVLVFVKKRFQKELTRHNCWNSLSLNRSWFFICQLLKNFHFFFTNSTLGPGFNGFRTSLSFNFNTFKLLVGNVV